MNEAKLRWRIVIRISQKLKTELYTAKLRVDNTPIIG